MGEAKRRQAALGDSYGKEERLLPWLPITKTQLELFYKITTRGAWIGIGIAVLLWVTVRFIGPAFGWWTVV